MLSPGQRCKKRRKAMGLTVNELADRCGTQHRVIIQFERDNLDPKFSMLAKIAKALKVRISYFAAPIEMLDCLTYKKEYSYIDSPKKRLPYRDYHPGRKKGQAPPRKKRKRP